MKLHVLLAAAAALAFALSGCAGLTGLPAGSADYGDTVTVQYSVALANGTALRTDRTATFHLGTGDSGLGLGFERALRGHAPGENLSFAVDDDPSLGFSEPVEVPRALAGVEQDQDAPRREFEASLGAATVGKQFPIFGVYTATVTGVTADRVNFTIDAKPGQRDRADRVGAFLVSEADGTTIHQSLEPNVGAVFVISPPAQPGAGTLLGLAPGTYRTVGGTETSIQYLRSASSSPDLVGKDLRFTVSIVRIQPGDHGIEPVDGNYAVRPSPYVNGDPATVLALEPAGEDEPDEHGH